MQGIGLIDSIDILDIERIGKFMKTFISTKPISVMRQEDIFPQPAPTVMYKNPEASDELHNLKDTKIERNFNDIY
jgi:hypothetical protein